MTLKPEAALKEAVWKGVEDLVLLLPSFMSSFRDGAIYEFYQPFVHFYKRPNRMPYRLTPIFKYTSLNERIQIIQIRFLYPYRDMLLPLLRFFPPHM